MIKSLTNQLHLTQFLYFYCMTEDKILEDYLAIFKEIVTDLEILELSTIKKIDLDFIVFVVRFIYVI